MYAYISPPVMVRLGKPAHSCEGAFTDKTGGCNSNAECSGKNVCLQAWDYIKGNLSRWKVTGGADFTTKPIQLVGMRKGSVYCPRGCTQGRVCSMSGYWGCRAIGGVTLIAKYDWVVRKTKGTWCVVFCIPKEYEATESAHHSRLI